MPKLKNSNVRHAVKTRQQFTNTNGTLFGRWETPFLYVVYSYGEHFPMFLYDNTPERRGWAINTDKRSATTSKHFSQAHPQCETVASDTVTLKKYILTAGREV